MLVGSIFIAIIIIIILVYRVLRLNLYLSFVFFMSILTYVSAMFFLASIGELVNASLLYLTWIFTSLTALYLFRILSAELRKSILAYHARGYQLKNELLIAFFLVLTFYLILTPKILMNPWWLSDENRSAFMSEESIFLRGVKLTPVILAAIAFAKPVLRKKEIIVLTSFSVLFSIYLGSKSGMIFLIATIALHATVFRISLMDTVRALNLPALIFLVFIAFFFSKIAMNADVTLIESLFDRQSSDVYGLTHVFNIDVFNACKDTSYLAPIQSTISKVFPIIDRPIGHLSYGNCLASPGDPSYPFELLTPLVLEIYGMYEPILVVPLVGIILLTIVMQFKFLGIIGNQCNVKALSFGAQGYFTYSMLSILYGGKYTNHIVSDYITMVLMLVLVGIFKYLFLLGARSDSFKKELR